MKISDFHGKVSTCFCTNHLQNQPMGCDRCYCRGYVAECLGCNGTGQKTESVAGGNGVMQTTCPACGGKKVFGVNKPADWETTHSPVEAKSADEIALDAPPPAGSVTPMPRSIPPMSVVGGESITSVMTR
jgi:DnaJ-class molecular chaperone